MRKSLLTELSVIAANGIAVCQEELQPLSDCHVVSTLFEFLSDVKYCDLCQCIFIGLCN